MYTLRAGAAISLIAFAACRTGQKPVVMFTIAGDPTLHDTIAGDLTLHQRSAASKIDGGQAVITGSVSDSPSRQMQLDANAIAREGFIDLKEIPRTKDQMMQLGLFADMSVDLKIDKIVKREDGIQSVSGHLESFGPGVLGHLENFGPGVAYLSIDDHKDLDPSNDEITATIERFDGTVFLIRPFRNSLHHVTEVRRDYGEKDGNEPIAPEPDRPRVQPEPTVDPGVLKILFVFSNQYSRVCTSGQGKANANNWKQQITDALVAARSNVTVDVAVFCSSDDLIAGNLKDSIDRLRTSADVAAARANTAADLVTLVVERGTETGLAFYNFILLPTDADRAYSAVRFTEALARKAIEHEIGHILGMQHDRFVLGGGDPSLCNYGTFIPIGSATPTHRTIMATRQFCTSVCDRLREYSDPNATTRPSGVACGNPTGADNALQLRRAAVVASRFFFP